MGRSTDRRGGPERADCSPVSADETAPALAGTEPRSRLEELFPLLAVGVVAFIVAVGHRSADVALYAHDARAMLHLPLRDALPVQYPALGGTVFLLAGVLALPYDVAFPLLMALALAGLVYLGPRPADVPGWTRRLALYLALGTLWVLFSRYDLAATLATLAAVESARRRRWGWAWTAGLVGTALQLFPALLLPTFFVAEWRQTGRLPWRRALAGTLVLVAFAVTQQVLAPGTLLDPFRFEVQRGFEIWSAPGTLTGLLSPTHLRAVHAFGTNQVVGADARAIGTALEVVAILSLLGIWAATLAGRLGVVAASLAVLSVAVATDRAFAPQYLIWLAPLWAYWPVRRGWVGAALLTTLVYPVTWGMTKYFHWSVAVPLAVGGVRNVVFVVATGTWLWNELRTGAGEQDISGSADFRNLGRARARPGPEPAG
jgi:hypothetical protein